MKFAIQCMMLLFLLILVICRPQRWLVRTFVPSHQTLSDCRSGDLIYFLEYGTIFPFPGHLAICVKLPRYSLSYVYDMPNILFHAPDLLKPLQSYIKNAKKRRFARVFIQRLQGPAIDLLPAIKYLASSSHFDLHSGVAHANITLRETFLLPSLPAILPSLEKKSLYYCTNAVLTLLFQAGVVENFWSDEEALCPSSMLSPDFQLNKFTKLPWKYGEPEEI
jgi:hypothetical protein